MNSLVILLGRAQHLAGDGGGLFFRKGRERQQVDQVALLQRKQQSADAFFLSRSARGHEKDLLVAEFDHHPLHEQLADRIHPLEAVEIHDDAPAAHQLLENGQHAADQHGNILRAVPAQVDAVRQHGREQGAMLLGELYGPDVAQIFQLDEHIAPRLHGIVFLDPVAVGGQLQNIGAVVHFQDLLHELGLAGAHFALNHHGVRAVLV